MLSKYLLNCLLNFMTSAFPNSSLVYSYFGLQLRLILTRQLTALNCSQKGQGPVGHKTDGYLFI